MKQEMIREAEQIRAKKEERVYPIEKTLNSLECLPERSLSNRVSVKEGVREGRVFCSTL